MSKGSRSRVDDKAAYDRNFERIFGRRVSETSTDVSDKPPNPGSPEAVAAGCTCPVLDNGHGRGSGFGGSGTFWMTEGCPVHRPAKGADHGR